EALATLMHSNTVNGGHEPADLAFLALAQHGLGQPEAARRTLAQLRAALKAAPSKIADPREAAASLREAEALIQLDPAFPADPFAPCASGATKYLAHAA